MQSRFARIGAVFYAFWGLIHVGGGTLLLLAALAGTDAFLRAQVGSSPVDPGHLAGGASTIRIADSVFAFHAFNLVWLGALTTAVAVRLNWYNSTPGYWMNLALVGFTDLGLLLFLVRTGTVPASDAWIGPVLFIPGCVFSTLALRAPRRANA